MRSGLIAISFLCLVSCAPPGTPLRVTHAPFPIKSLTAAAVGSGNQLEMAKGLPFQCQSSAPKKKLACIKCNIQSEVLSLRCIQTRSTLKPQNHCVHDSKKVKCLLGEKAIYINLARPQEKTFQLQLELLIENLSAIALNKIHEKEDQQLLQALLGAVSEISSEISTLEADKIGVIAEELSTPLALDAKPFEKELTTIYQKRLRGRLNSDSSRQMLLGILDGLPQFNEVRKILEDISVQGIDANILD